VTLTALPGAAVAGANTLNCTAGRLLEMIYATPLELLARICPRLLIAKALVSVSPPRSTSVLRSVIWPPLYTKASYRAELFSSTWDEPTMVPLSLMP
jgi:hypothetical protein